MRFGVAVFLGLFTVTVAIPVGCSGPESVNSAGGPSSGSVSGTGGAAGGGGTGGTPIPIDGYQECTDYCVKHAELCTGAMAEHCITRNCVEWKKDVGPECQDEFDAYFACVNAWVHTLSPSDPDVCLWFGGDCGPPHAKLSNCQYDYGCVLADGCWDRPAPNGGTGCLCQAWCQQRELKSLCWTEAAKQICDCTIDGVSVGMCEEPQQPCPNATFYEDCCVQYFMIP